MLYRVGPFSVPPRIALFSPLGLEVPVLELSIPPAHKATLASLSPWILICIISLLSLFEYLPLTCFRLAVRFFTTDRYLLDVLRLLTYSDLIIHETTFQRKPRLSTARELAHRIFSFSCQCLSEMLPVHSRLVYDCHRLP